MGPSSPASLGFTSREAEGNHGAMAPPLGVHQCNSEGIQELCRQIADGLQTGLHCPCCSATLQVTMAIHGLEVSCPSGCFRFDCRRDPHTGTFVSGLLDFPASQGSTGSSQPDRPPVEDPGAYL